MQTLNKDALGTLNQAIEDFNNWDGAALVYYNKAENYFNTLVFNSDVAKAETILSDNCYGVYGRSERSTVKIGTKRTAYIEEFADLLNEGYDAHKAEYHLIMKYPFI